MCDNIYKRSNSVGNQSFWLRTHFRYRQQFYWHSTRAIEIDITESCISIHAHSQLESLSLFLLKQFYRLCRQYWAMQKWLNTRRKWKFSSLYNFVCEPTHRVKNTHTGIPWIHVDVGSGTVTQKYTEWAKTRLKNRDGRSQTKMVEFLIIWHRQHRNPCMYT